MWDSAYKQVFLGIAVQSDSKHGNTFILIENQTIIDGTIAFSSRPAFLSPVSVVRSHGNQPGMRDEPDNLRTVTELVTNIYEM